MPPSIRNGPVRARDLRANIAELGFERGVVHTLELLLDEYAETRQNMREVADLIQMMTENMAKMVHVGERAMTQINELQRRSDQGDAINHGEG